MALSIQPHCLFRVEPEDDWDEQISRKQLNRRGWVVEERLLAPRILHFGKTKLFWKCRMIHASESDFRGVSHTMRWPNTTTYLYSRVQREQNKYGSLRRGWIVLRKLGRIRTRAMGDLYEKKTEHQPRQLRYIWQETISMYEV